MDFGASKYLKDENDYRLYLAQAFEGGDPVEIQAAPDDVAKARGMTALAEPAPCVFLPYPRPRCEPPLGKFATHTGGRDV
jgi:hypothetical protein